MSLVSRKSKSDGNFVCLYVFDHKTPIYLRTYSNLVNGRRWCDASRTQPRPNWDAHTNTHKPKCETNKMDTICSRTTSSLTAGINTQVYKKGFQGISRNIIKYHYVLINKYHGTGTNIGTYWYYVSQFRRIPVFMQNCWLQSHCSW